ncbi:draG [Symbiodinium natans]|uniref:DraG protein n=1 Tax=Symbiodinium natans TaxID=878477 RepID=A0A812TSZ4_9DINO|nr:draG [Symbiodinium natans]
MGEEARAMRAKRPAPDLPADAATRYAITFGEAAVLHIGGEEVGARASAGFSVAELQELAEQLSAQGVVTEMVSLSDALPKKMRKGNEAATLVIRNGAAVLLQQEEAAAHLLREQQGLRYDSKYWDGRRGKTLTKRALEVKGLQGVIDEHPIRISSPRARHNLVFGEEAATPTEVHSSLDGSDHSITVRAFRDLPHLADFRAALPARPGKFDRERLRLGEKARGLFAEGNHCPLDDRRLLDARLNKQTGSGRGAIADGAQ